ncbi:hypothetical protein SNEBB_008057 [Seison nebaliae]|nr:hypothetical protein SNEBB_008057 [Seison nebaliae]
MSKVEQNNNLRIKEELTFYDRLNESIGELEILDEPIKFRIFYNSEIIVTYLQKFSKFSKFQEQIKIICHLDVTDPITIKWMDDEGDPCLLQCNIELGEVYRLYDVNHDNEIQLHVFKTRAIPGERCPDEERISRMGARRWKKIYLYQGHKYQQKLFSRNTRCTVCAERIWGLGRQGFRCLVCKLMVHKKCYKFVVIACSDSSSLLAISHHNLYNSQKENLNIKRTQSLPRSQVPSQDQETKETTTTDKQQLVRNEKTPCGMRRSFRTTGTKRTKTKTEEDSTTKDSLDAENLPRTRTPKIGLKDFNLLRVIGRGSYAKVLQVEFKRTGRIYAMKVIKKSTVHDDEDIDWVQTEKHVFERATNHPFLVGLHSCFQSDTRLFFVIEFVNGGDLMYHMQRQRRLPEDHARFYSAEISLALHFLHSKGIIYRDLKLDNVLLDSDGHIKLTDYGMCKEGLSNEDRTATFCGTPNYIAPEMLRGEEYSFSVDWWALGVLMFEMMAGRSPFEIVGAIDNPELNTEDALFQIILERPIRIPRNLSVPARKVLMGFLNKNPKDRLGCRNEGGFLDINMNGFFKSIDWHLLEKRLVQPPYKPLIRNERDLEHFDPQFTNEPVSFTPQPSINGGSAMNSSANDHSEFEGFEYINPLILTMEDTV